MDLELRHLRVVCAVADTGSVTKAAAHLGLAQPALTAQLNRIEKILGGQLFERDRQGARPTALGELVLSRARVLLPAMTTLKEEAARLANRGAADRYRLGSVSGQIFGRLMHRLAAGEPQAQISSYVCWSQDELVAMAAAGRLDFVLLGLCGDAAPPAEGELSWQDLMAVPVWVLLPDHHPLAGRTEVKLAELPYAQWIALRGDGCFADCFSAACARAGFSPKPVYEVDYPSVFDLVQAGDGVALCQATVRPMPGVVPVPLTGAPMRWRHVLGWRPEGPAAGRAQQVIGYAEQACDDVVTRSARYSSWLREHPEFDSRRLPVLDGMT
jgi:DNA-binding transcriptional LysR family regulator